MMSLFAEYAPGGAPLPRVHGLVVREARPDDVDAVAALGALRNGGSLDTWRARVARQVGRRKRQRLFVAETAGRVIGYAWVKHVRGATGAPDGWYLLGIVVDPEWRRRGVGTALTRARLAFIAERAGEAFYAANAQNAASVDLHAPFGFVEQSRDFALPRVSFDGGQGVLFRAKLARP